MTDAVVALAHAEVIATQTNLTADTLLLHAEVIALQTDLTAELLQLHLEALIPAAELLIITPINSQQHICT